MNPTLLESSGVVYAGITLVLLGVFVGDETNYRNPRYSVAIAFAVGWPVVLLFALFQGLARGGPE